MERQISRLLFGKNEGVVGTGLFRRVNDHIKHVRVHFFDVVQHRIGNGKPVKQPVDRGVQMNTQPFRQIGVTGKIDQG
ncbi:hypothetical protein D1872_313110 [compost metagenome]